MTGGVIQIATPFVGDEEFKALAEVVESGWLTQGPAVARFEKAFAVRHEVPHAVAVSSCTTGLHLALSALGVGPGDEVIVPSFTWIASANAVVHCGATPVLCDIDPITFNIDVADAAARVTKRTKAVMAVHLFGLCADIDSLRVTLPPGIAIIEDAACAAGASYKGKPAGGLGDIAVFSFHPRKTITTGEGGMITTSDNDLAAQVSMLRNHGATISEEQRHLGPRPHFLPDFPVVGYNYRMTDLQGAVGVAQMCRLDNIIDARARWADFYRRELSALNWLRCPDEPADGRHGWQAFVAMVDEEAPFAAADIMNSLQSKGIASRPGTHAVHMQEYYRKVLGCNSSAFPFSQAAAEGTIAIPLHNRMAGDDFQRVVAALCDLK